MSNTAFEIKPPEQAAAEIAAPAGDYPFDLIKPGEEQADLKRYLRKRPFAKLKNSLKDQAPLFMPGEQLTAAINTAIALGEPLLITGESGTGKTQAAYYVAYKLGLSLFHFQIKSDTAAQDLLYRFDAVRYFYEANVRRTDAENADPNGLDKSKFIQKGDFWRALEAAEPCVLLIDEIDKAPRDFPNDLLHELDQMSFNVVETGETIQAGEDWQRPLVFITSNKERRLPEPFLRRCVFHNIKFTPDIAQKAIAARRTEFATLSDDVINLALKRFLALRELPALRKPPATGELLIWLRVLSLKTNLDMPTLEQNLLESGDLSKLPYLGTLIKDTDDLASIKTSY